MRSLGLLSCVLLSALGQASPFAAGDLLITNQPFRDVAKFTREGTFVQNIHVPKPVWQSDPFWTEVIRDVHVTPSGNLVVYNGTFDAGLSYLNMNSGAWTHYQIPGMSVVNGGTSGKLAVYGDYVFATDEFTYNGGEAAGAIRLDLRDGSWTRFAPKSAGGEAIDVTLGADGLLWTLNGNGSPSGRYIEAFDPISLELKKQLILPMDFVYGEGQASRSIAVDKDGFIYLNQLYGPIYKLSPNGQVLDSFTYPHEWYVDDMDVDANGNVLVTEWDGRVVLLDSNFQITKTFKTFDYMWPESFGGIVPVPEPTPALAFSGLVICLVWRRKLSARVR